MIKGNSENLRPYICDVCGIRFYFKTDLEEHMKQELEGWYSK